MKIAAYKVPSAALAARPDTERNLLLSLMLAHNELGTLNKLLMFSINVILDDALGEISHAAQTFTILKLLTGKLHETWKLIQKYYVKPKLDTKYSALMEPSAKAAYESLTAYFKPGNKNNMIKLIRDTAAFHYAGFDYGKALRELGDGEEKVYLALHPANSLYYVGEAVNWRALIQSLHNLPDVTKELAPDTATIDEKHRAAFNVLNRHINEVNLQMHLLLYGLIKTTIDRALGDDWEKTEHEFITISGAPNPADVALPTLIDVEAAKKSDNS